MINSKNLKELIPGVGPLLIICGYIKLNIIYSHFNIDIYNYLQFTEILTLFLPDILRSLITIIIIFVMIVVFLNKRKIDRNFDDHVAISSEKSFFKRLIIAFKKFNLIVILIIGMSINAIISTIWFPKFTTSFLVFSMFGLSFLIYMIVMYEFERNLKNTFDKSITNSQAYITFIIFFFLASVMQSAYLEIQRIENNPSKITFTYLDKQISTENKDTYLGQTKEYLFIKKDESKKINVYDKRNIENFSIENRDF